MGGAKQAAEKLVGNVILSIDSLAAAHNTQKLGPWKGSADLFFRSALHLLNSEDLRVEFLQRSSGDEESRIALKMLRARSFA